MLHEVGGTDAAILSPAERARADRLPPVPRRRFLARHAAVRRILAGYAVDFAPADLPIVTDPHGRPRWAGGPVDFNLSHRGPHAVLAVAAAGEDGGPTVGVDLELDPTPEDQPRLDALADSFFTDAERAALPADAAAQAAAVVRLWSAKEAVLKAAGCGLHRPAADVAVTWTGDGGGRAGFDDRRFALAEVRPAAGCRVVAAVPGECPPGVRVTGAGRPPDETPH